MRSSKACFRTAILICSAATCARCPPRSPYPAARAARYERDGRLDTNDVVPIWCEPVVVLRGLDASSRKAGRPGSPVLGDGTRSAKKKNTPMFAGLNPRFGRGEVLREVGQALPSGAGCIQYSPTAVSRTAKRA